MVTELTAKEGSNRKDLSPLVGWECVLGLLPARHPYLNKHQTLGGGRGICVCMCIIFIVSNYKIFQKYFKHSENNAVDTICISCFTDVSDQFSTFFLKTL